MSCKLHIGTTNDNAYIPGKGAVGDDDGRTYGVEAHVDCDDFYVKAQHNSVTAIGGEERNDHARLTAGINDQIQTDNGGELSFSVGAGVALTGPLGGDRLQDAWHSIIGERRLPGAGEPHIPGYSLQDSYVGGVTAAPTFEASASYKHPVGDANAILEASMQATLGPGELRGRLAGGFDFEIVPGFTAEFMAGIEGHAMTGDWAPFAGDDLRSGVSGFVEGSLGYTHPSGWGVTNALRTNASGEPYQLRIGLDIPVGGR